MFVYKKFTVVSLGMIQATSTKSLIPYNWKIFSILGGGVLLFFFFVRILKNNLMVTKISLHSEFVSLNGFAVTLNFSFGV